MILKQANCSYAYGNIGTSSANYKRSTMKGSAAKLIMDSCKMWKQRQRDVRYTVNTERGSQCGAFNAIDRIQHARNSVCKISFELYIRNNHFRILDEKRSGHHHGYLALSDTHPAMPYWPLETSHHQTGNNVDGIYLSKKKKRINQKKTIQDTLN